MVKPVPDVRMNFGDFVGPVTAEARVKTSAAMTSATALASTTAFASLNFFTFTDSSVPQGVGQDNRSPGAGRVAGPRGQCPVTRPSDRVELVEEWDKPTAPQT